MSVSWPNGHKFAFTIFDDTDFVSLEKVKSVYDFLSDLGMRTTKSVWVMKGEGTPTNGGATCEDRNYLNWLLALQERGFEIALHNIAPTTSPRKLTRLGLDRFRELFGDRMAIHCNHLGCLENIYWGAARLSSWRGAAYKIVKRKNAGISRGHVEGDPLFWGDLCRERISYVRNFVFERLNTLAMCPEMPYHDSRKPFVNFWFASTNGSSLRRFLGNFTLANLDQLIDEGGMCIAYVHFACGFAYGREIDPAFRERMEYISSKNGWFAPVSQILDFLRNGESCEDRTISSQKLDQLETRWLASKIFRGTS